MLNYNLQKLVTIAQKPTKLILGLMSGTSLDGLDIALCKVKGNGLNTTINLLGFETIAFNKDFIAAIQSIFSKKNIDLEKLCVLNPYIALTHAKIINAALKKWQIKQEDIDLIASHGQTIYHAPKILHNKNKYPNATLQIGDGDHLAVATGIITISDFRQKHIAAGGEGAPLAAYGDYILFSKDGEERILLNIGGIANFTYLPASKNITQVFSTDTGPGNTLMDAYVQQNFKNKFFDKDAVLALQGNANAKLLDALLDNIFFNQELSKTTGPELFNLDYLQKAKEKSLTQNLTIEDTLATLNKFTAITISNAIKKNTLISKSYTLLCSGGGVHNPLLISHLKELLSNNFLFHTTDALSINPDAKEAVLFAILANECISGDGAYLDNASKFMPKISMGKISFPQ